MQKEHIVRADETFLAELTRQSGPEYVKRLNALMEDVRGCADLIRDFGRTRNLFSGFSVIVLAKSAWVSVEPSRAVPPRMSAEHSPRSLNSTKRSSRLEHFSGVWISPG
jgi:hypothetical protein